MPLQGIAALCVAAAWVVTVIAVFLGAVRHEKKNDAMHGDDE